MTRATSSLVISRSFPATATTPRLLKDRTWEPEIPAQAREIWTPAMISASSAARLMASMVASTLMMLPLRVPRLAEAPLPMTSSAPAAFCSPMRTQILEEPISQATRKFSGLAITRPGGGTSETIPCAVRADENDAIGKTKIDGPRLPPATLNEPPRLEQCANLRRRIRPLHANRLSKDRIHHTESPVGERGDFRERDDVVRTRAPQIFDQPDGFGKPAALTRHDDVLGAIPAGIVRRDRAAVRPDPPEAG